jgi:hypothetical protein
MTDELNQVLNHSMSSQSVSKTQNMQIQSPNSNKSISKSSITALFHSQPTLKQEDWWKMNRNSLTTHVKKINESHCEIINSKVLKNSLK